jgi:carbon monoxide dehydrogenase subunit G
VTIVVGVTIAAPPDVVWRAIEQVERHVDWMADAESITFVGPTTRGPGTTFDCVTRIGPFRTVDRMRVTQWEPGRVLAIEHEGVVRGAGRFDLAAAGRSTRFTWTERLQFPWWMGAGAGAFIASPLLRRIWRANLVRLRDIVEGT